MADDLKALEEWVAPLLAKLEAKERRALARSIARDCGAVNASASGARPTPTAHPTFPASLSNGGLARAAFAAAPCSASATVSSEMAQPLNTLSANCSASPSRTARAFVTY